MNIFNIHELIPGGCHTYSKGDDQFSSNSPKILDRGKGCYVWDINKSKYLDYGMGLRSVTIGYGDQEIIDSAVEELYKGNNLTRATFTEYKAAELFVQTIPSADMVKFSKNGSNVTTAAIKLGRSFNLKKYVAICKNHPFFSFDDWFIGTTSVKRGIPEDLYRFSLTFYYNDIESLRILFKDYDISSVIMEPVTTQSPFYDINDKSRNFLKEVRELCNEYGAILIFDEMITGFRWSLSGAADYFNVTPDLCTFGKGMANGFSLSALGGKKDIMNLGGIQDIGKERTFLLSTTHGAEMCSLGAFIKTVEIYQRDKVIEHIWEYGKELKDGINQISADLGIIDNFHVDGYPCLPSYYTDDEKGNYSFEYKTLFGQEMVKRGVLMPYISISNSHNQETLDITLEAAREALATYKKALKKGVNGYLIGDTIKPVFRKNN